MYRYLERIIFPRPGAHLPAVLPILTPLQIAREPPTFPIDYIDSPPMPRSKRPNSTESPTKSAESPPSHPPYRGVRRRAWGRYVSEIRLPRKSTRVWLGSFSSAESAALAHDTASLFLHGQQATLNFPELAGLLPRPHSSSPQAIRAAAAKAASSRTDDRVTLSHDESTQFIEWVEECFSFDDSEDHVQL